MTVPQPDDSICSSISFGGAAQASAFPAPHQPPPVGPLLELQHVIGTRRAGRGHHHALLEFQSAEDSVRPLVIGLPGCAGTSRARRVGGPRRGGSGSREASAPTPWGVVWMQCEPRTVPGEVLFRSARRLRKAWGGVVHQQRSRALGMFEHHKLLEGRPPAAPDKKATTRASIIAPIREASRRGVFDGLLSLTSLTDAAMHQRTPSRCRRIGVAGSALGVWHGAPGAWSCRPRLVTGRTWPA